MNLKTMYIFGSQEGKLPPSLPAGSVAGCKCIDTHITPLRKVVNVTALLLDACVFVRVCPFLQPEICQFKLHKTIVQIIQGYL